MTTEQIEMPWYDWYKRASICITACAGMEDPEKEIAKLRADKRWLVDALDQVLSVSDMGNVIMIEAREVLDKVQAKEATND